MAGTEAKGTIGQNEVTVEDCGDYKIYHSHPPRTLADDPPTSDAARAHGLRRIKRRHFSDLIERMSPEAQQRIKARTSAMLAELHEAETVSKGD
jgi:hypothetical protein